MSGKAEIYFHLGYPKVASTYFQKVIFPRLKNVNFIPKHKFNTYRNLSGKDPSGIYLFSSEKDYNIIEALEDIIKYVPSPKIILFVRRHEDWLLSRYKYRIRKHGSESFQEFFDLESNNGLWKREQLFYRQTIKEVEKISNNPPLVLTYTLLNKNPEDFIRRLTIYLRTSLVSGKIKQERIHTAFNERQLIVLRKYNRLHPYTKLRSPSKLRNKFHYKYREFLIHIIALFSLFIPAFLLNEKSLLTEADKTVMKKIRAYYEEDWAFCECYSEKDY